MSTTVVGSVRATTIADEPGRVGDGMGAEVLLEQFSTGASRVAVAFTAGIHASERIVRASFEPEMAMELGRLFLRCGVLAGAGGPGAVSNMDLLLADLRSTTAELQVARADRQFLAAKLEAERADKAAIAGVLHEERANLETARAELFKVREELTQAKSVVVDQREAISGLESRLNEVHTEINFAMIPGGSIGERVRAVVNHRNQLAQELLVSGATITTQARDIRDLIADRDAIEEGLRLANIAKAALLKQRDEAMESCGQKIDELGAIRQAINRHYTIPIGQGLVEASDRAGNLYAQQLEAERVAFVKRYDDVTAELGNARAEKLATTEPLATLVGVDAGLYDQLIAIRNLVSEEMARCGIPVDGLYPKPSVEAMRDTLAAIRAAWGPPDGSSIVEGVLALVTKAKQQAVDLLKMERQFKDWKHNDGAWMDRVLREFLTMDKSFGPPLEHATLTQLVLDVKQRIQAYLASIASMDNELESWRNSEDDDDEEDDDDDEEEVDDLRDRLRRVDANYEQVVADRDSLLIQMRRLRLAVAALSGLAEEPGPASGGADAAIAGATGAVDRLSNAVANAGHGIAMAVNSVASAANAVASDDVMGPIRTGLGSLG